MKDKDYWRARICRLMAFNEAIFGQERDRLEEFLAETGVTLGLNLDEPFSLCLTGLEKRFYSNRLGMTRQEFIALTFAAEQHLEERLTRWNTDWEGRIIQYDLSKQICYLFPMSETTPFAVAQKLQNEMMALYAATPHFADSGLCNVTALVERVENYDDLADAFERARNLNRYGFFLMKSCVVTERLIAWDKKPCSAEQAFSLINQVERAANRGNKLAIEKTLRILFLDRLRSSFDFDLVKDVLFELRKKLLRYSSVFQLTLEDDIATLFVKRFATIGELHNAVLALFYTCSEATACYPRGIGSFSLEAIYYMRNQFQREIGLDDVAEHVGVSSCYLSRVFNREVGESVPGYLNRIRINSAAALLESSQMGSNEIGKAVGIESAQYFSALFKKQMGTAPQEYRRLYRAARSNEKE